MEEVWKDIRRYEEIYQISNLGRVKSLSRKIHYYNSAINKPKTRLSKDKILKPGVVGGGYLAYNLTKSKVSTMYLVHRLVADAFIPNPKNKPNINHIDFDKKNNNVSNLEWCTQKENIQHAIKHKRFIIAKGEDYKRSLFKNEDIINIRILSNRLSNAEIGRMYNCSRNTIWHIVNRKSWKHII